MGKLREPTWTTSVNMMYDIQAIQFQTLADDTARESLLREYRFGWQSIAVNVGMHVLRTLECSFG